MITAVVSYHQNPLTCGVARFSQDLATRLGVPFVGFADDWGAFPLLSLKWSELPVRAQVALADKCEAQPYALFWHDRGHPDLTEAARVVFSGDPLFPGRALWCPPTVAAAPGDEAQLRLFAFGMAHKLQVDPYRHVRALLEAAGLSFRLRVSVALHEGTSIDACSMHFRALDTVVGAAHVQVLGCLSDTALTQEMQTADVICAFFETGVRANNTSVQAAMALGKPVLTNLDLKSPRWYQHRQTVMDIEELLNWPEPSAWADVGAAGARVYADHYDWPAFLSQFQEGLHATVDHR